MTAQERLAAILESLTDATRPSDTLLSELQTLNATVLRIAVALEKIAVALSAPPPSPVVDVIPVPGKPTKH
jgi:hypothetical protein